MENRMFRATANASDPGRTRGITARLITLGALLGAAAQATAQCGAPMFPNPKYPAGEFPWEVAVGDLDGDGDRDLVIANGFGDDTVSVLLNACDTPGPCNTADLAEQFDVLDLADLVAFVTAFKSEDPEADLVEPYGVIDFGDAVAFVVALNTGCP